MPISRETVCAPPHSLFHQSRTRRISANTTEIDRNERPICYPATEPIVDMSDLIEALQLALEELEELRNAELDYEAYKRNRVTLRRQIVRSAAASLKNAREIYGVPKCQFDSVLITAALERIKADALDSRLQNLSQAIVELREDLQLCLIGYRGSIDWYGSARLKCDIIDYEDERADLVNYADELMAYGIAGECDSSPRWRAGACVIEFGKESGLKPDIREQRGCESAPADLTKPRGQCKRSPTKPSQTKRHRRRRRTPQPLSFRILKTIRRTAFLWSSAFEKWSIRSLYIVRLIPSVFAKGD